MDYGTRPQRISCQYGYIRTVPGILKTIELVSVFFYQIFHKRNNLIQYIQLCDIIALILGAAAPSENYTGHRGFFMFVAALAIIITTFLFLLALINLQAVCIPERWVMIVSYLNKYIKLFWKI